MLLTEHPERNTLYAVHGRHGSQSLRRFAGSHPDFRIILDVGESKVMSDTHFRGKIRTIVRDPWEKFQSGLSWILSNTLPDDNAFYGWDCHDYATTERIISAIMFASCTASSFETLMTDHVTKQPTDLANRFQIEDRNHFRYHLGETHLMFTNLSLVFLVALDLNIEVFDIKDIDLIYKEYGYVDRDVNKEGKYVPSDTKKQFYSDIVEIYMNTLDYMSENKTYNHYFEPSRREFNNLMSLETRAYNALKSDNKVEDCKSFVRDLVKGILDQNTKPKIEISYLIQGMTLGNAHRFMHCIPYKSDMYPLVCLLASMQIRFVPGSWQEHLLECENLLNQ